MTSVIMESKVKDQVYLLRCLNPTCRIKTGVKVSQNGKVLIENGIQVFNFFKPEEAEKFLDKIKKFTRLYDLKHFVITDDSKYEVDNSLSQDVGHILFMILAGVKAKHPELDQITSGEFTFKVR